MFFFALNFFFFLYFLHFLQLFSNCFVVPCVSMEVETIAHILLHLLQISLTLRIYMQVYGLFLILFNILLLSKYRLSKYSECFLKKMKKNFGPQTVNISFWFEFYKNFTNLFFSLFSQFHRLSTLYFMLITWLSESCLTSLIVLFWNFPLLFSHSKNFRMSTLITMIITS